jgi:hypothetical protein
VELCGTKRRENFTLALPESSACLLLPLLQRRRFPETANHAASDLYPIELQHGANMKFSKIVVTFTLRSGKEIKVKCKGIKINQQSNELLSYEMEGVDTGANDPVFYLRLDSIDHIAYRRVFW